MDCEQVFNVLTCGPFPTGTSVDRGVERHLARCAGCHRIAEALRPAVELLTEAIDPEESRTLPGYWGPSAVAPAPGGVATQFKPRVRRIVGPLREEIELQASERLEAGRSFDRRLLLFMLGIILGALLATIAASTGVPLR